MALFLHYSCSVEPREGIVDNASGRALFSNICGSRKPPFYFRLLFPFANLIKTHSLFLAAGRAGADNDLANAS